MRADRVGNLAARVVGIGRSNRLPCARLVEVKGKGKVETWHLVGPAR